MFSRLCISVLLSFLLPVNIGTKDIYSTSWALVVGINDYQSIRDLSYGVEDALAVKNLLINDYNFPRDNVKVLIDSDATRYNIKKEFDKIVRNSAKEDRVVFYFAGHGETETVGLEEKRMGYLMPVEGELDNKYMTAIPMSELKQIANMSKAKHMLFMVDACYGGLAAVDTRGLTDTKAPNYIDVISSDFSRQIITAGGADQEVQSRDEWEHSAFTKNLLSGLREQKADINLEGIITGSEIGEYIREKVSLDTENAQTPQSRRLTTHDGEMIFISNKKKRAKKENNTEQDLQELMNQLLAAQKQTVTKTYETVTLPGNKGFYLLNNKEFLVEEIFYSPDGLKYRGKIKLSIGMDEDASWSPTVSVLVKDVLPMDGEATGQFNYSTGRIE